MCKESVSIFIAIMTVLSAVFTAAAEVDDYQTIALWHMESAVSGTDRCGNARSVIADDNSITNQGRAARPLILGQRVASCPGTINANTLPSITAGLFGNCLDFDKSKVQYSFTNGGWGNQDNVLVDMYFYPTTFATNQALVGVTNSFQLRLTGGIVKLYVWDGAATPSVDSPAVTLNQWNHIVASVVNGQMKIALDGVDGTTGTCSGMNDCHHPNFYVGGAYNGGLPFDGLIDEVKISDPTAQIPAFAAPYQDDYNTFILYHCDEILELSPRRTPDDDSFNPGRSLEPARNLDGVLMPESIIGADYTGPVLAPSFGADPNEGFKKCFQFDGFRAIKVQGTDQYDGFGIPQDNFRIELWAKHDAAKKNDGYEYYFFHQPDKFRFSIRDLAGGVWDARFATWGASGATTLDVPVADPTKWHHYAFEFYQGTMKTYIDGALGGTKTTAYTTTNAPVRQLYIGSDNNNGHRIIGRVDEFKISRAVAATPECGFWGYSPADINQDCYVNDLDIIEMASQWLVDCTQDGSELCL